jgi:hypothetical protein
MRRDQMIFTELNVFRGFHITWSQDYQQNEALCISAPFLNVYGKQLLQLSLSFPYKTPHRHIGVYVCHSVSETEILQGFYPI